MGNPQIDQLKAAPLQALRAVFTGIGRILMAADRPQDQVVRTNGQAEGANGQRTPRSRQPGASATPEANSRWRSLDTTGNVRLLSAEDLDDDGPEARKPAVTEPAATTEPAVAAEPAAATEPAQAEETNDLGSALPLASYDTLSLPSIRARLRNLDANQLRVLAGYERTNAERPEVLGMLERRIEKLETGG